MGRASPVRGQPARTAESDELGEFLERVAAVEDDDLEEPARWERFFREVARLLNDGAE